MLGYVTGSKEVLLSITDLLDITTLSGFEVMDDTPSYPGDPPSGPSSGVLFANEPGRAIILGRNEIRHVWLDLEDLIDLGSSRVSFGDDPSYPDSLSNFGFLTDDYFVVSRVLDAELEIHLLKSDVTDWYFDFSVDHGFTNVAATKVTLFDDTASGLTNIFTCSHEPDSSTSLFIDKFTDNGHVKSFEDTNWVQCLSAHTIDPDQATFLVMDTAHKVSIYAIDFAAATMTVTPAR